MGVEMNERSKMENNSKKNKRRESISITLMKSNTLNVVVKYLVPVIYIIFTIAYFTILTNINTLQCNNSENKPMQQRKESIFKIYIKFGLVCNT